MTVKPAAARAVRRRAAKARVSVFLEDVVGEVGSGVGAAVGGVEDEDLRSFG